MKEEKSFWEKLKRWIDGDEVLLDAEEFFRLETFAPM